MLASIIIPVYNRENVINRCLGSLANSGLITDRGAYEVIVVDDASKDGTVKAVEKWCEKFPYNIILLKFKDHQERVVAMNAGLRTAQGQWLMRLDSDDEMMTHWKKSFEDMLDMYPRAQLFNWGSLIHHRDQAGHYTKTSIRQAFRPGIEPTGQTKIFKSGGIANGAFVFSKDLLWHSGFLPERSNPYSFGSAVLGRFKELKPLYTLPDGRQKTDLGNPWGDDFALFYSLTRYSNPVTVDQILHQIHVRI